MTNVEYFIEIGIALSSEKDHQILLEKILQSAMQLTKADAGTIYSTNEDHQLVFQTLFNNSLDMHIGGSSGQSIEFDNIPIKIAGEKNENAIVAIAAASGEIINIDNVYSHTEYDLTAAKAMDQQLNYKTQSVLTLPMCNHHGELNGVIQLINATDADNNVTIFDDQTKRIAHALSSLAAVIITNNQLTIEMENLFGAFSKLIATAIDKKSPYTGGHCRRVPEITMMLAKACHEIDYGPISDFTMTDDDFHELSVAAWLHDCGKVATPEYVMDKATKLQTVFDRIALIDARFEIAARDIYTANNISDEEKTLALKELEQDRAFVREANTGGEFFDDDKINRIYQIEQRYKVSIAGVTQSVLSKNEIENLITKRGTLTAKERQIINGHMDVTVEMLESMPFPKHLKNVPEYACGHHEKMDGTGYPKGLKRHQMSIPARIMAIADVFEALTASDRPYKPPKPLSETLTIMGRMKLNDHLDPDLFDVFVEKKIYLKFAEAFLHSEQIDGFNIAEIPGCQPIK